MVKISKRMKIFSLIISVCAALTIILSSYLLYKGSTQFDEFVFFAIIIMIFPSALLNYLDYKWRKAVDEHLPDLFRSIVQAQDAGMTLPQALDEVSKRNYGPLTLELKKLTTQISWGMTFEEALLSLEKRVNTTLTQKTIPIIIEANRSGGQVEKVFRPLGKFVKATLLQKKQQRNRTRPYIAIIYVAYFVFLFTVVLLFKSFFSSVEDLPIFSSGVIAPQEMWRNFFHMAIIQAFFGGLTAGKMGEGNSMAGLKHSLVLMICGYIGLRLFL